MLLLRNHLFMDTFNAQILGAKFHIFVFHGECPHRIKVCIVKKDNDPKVWTESIGYRWTETQMIKCSREKHTILKTNNKLSKAR